MVGVVLVSDVLYLPPKESYCQEAYKCACGACTALQVQR